MQKYRFSKLLSWYIKFILITTTFISIDCVLCTKIPIEKNDVTQYFMQNHVCKTSNCSKAARLILEKIDKTIDPCDNFYQFACGKYLDDYYITDDSSGFSIIGRIYAKTYRQLKVSLEEPINNEDPRTFQLLKSYYNICLDIEKIEETSIKKLEGILDELGGWPVILGESWNESTFDWKNLIYKLRRMGYSNSMNSFINFEVDVNEKNNTEYVITLDQALLGLEHEYLLEGIQGKVVKSYYQYMVNLAVILGADRKQAEKELAESLIFEMELAQIFSPMEERTNRSQLYNPMSVNELQLRYPGIPWSEYLNEILRPHFHLEPNDKVIVKDKKFFENLTQLFSKTPKRVLANYAIRLVVQESTAFMNNETRQIEEKLSASVTGTEVQFPRWGQCIDYLYWNLPLATGAFYVRKHFDKSLKSHVENLMYELRKSFENTLKKADWMDDKTKRAALNKLKSIHTHVAYPVEFFDDESLDGYFEDLKTVSESFLDSHLSLNRFYFDKMIHQLGKPSNKTSWFTHGSSADVNAYYQPTENSIELSAGYIQEELFAIDRPNYMNYGAIGSAMGHEFAHAFDDVGIQYDEEGNLSNWWNTKSLKEYQKRAQCIVEQYSNYTVAEVRLKINGAKTLGENMADNGGIKEAYFAYEQYEKQYGPELRLPGLAYTPRQIFWISAAHTYCEKYRLEATEDLLLTDVYSPGEFRVTGPFSNMPEFSRDFGCSPGSPMNPPKKCSMW